MSYTLIIFFRVKCYGYVPIYEYNFRNWFYTYKINKNYRIACALNHMLDNIYIYIYYFLNLFKRTIKHNL